MVSPGRRPGLHAALLALGLAGVVAVAHGRQEDFPHEEHAGLFPLCEGCHEGVLAGDSATFYPPATTCEGCHDGTREPRVEYEQPMPDAVSLLRFDHPEHDAETGQDLACESCHARDGARRMEVRQAVVDQCLECHEHAAPDHLVAADCVRCHTTFAASGLPPSRALDLPVPDPHRADDFLLEGHGQSAQANPARCSVCHVRDRCVACHVDPQAAPALAQVTAAPGRVALPEEPARYPEPPSHRDPGWLEAHGPLATAAPASCSTCHTQQSCTSCHRAATPAAVADMPVAGPGAAPGVVRGRVAPGSHYTPGFETEHGTLAAAAPAQCAACHTRTDCESCHNTAARAPFHPQNFAFDHASAAYGRRLECSSCHSTERFCRDCHSEAGMRASGRLTAGFHDAEPLWLLRHGQAARQGLESCTSCHTQRDCMQCHSELGAFKVSPHGPGFDARRAQKKNARVCFACHLDNPLAESP